MPYPFFVLRASPQSFGSLLRLLLSCCGKLEFALVTCSDQQRQQHKAGDDDGSSATFAYVEAVPAAWEAIQVTVPLAGSVAGAGGAAGLGGLTGLLAHRFAAAGARGTRRQQQQQQQQTGSRGAAGGHAAAAATAGGGSSSLMELLTTGFGVGQGLRR
jgi:hypothetical protein